MAYLGVFSVFVSGLVIAGLSGCTITVQSGPSSPANGYAAPPVPAPVPATVVYVPVAQPQPGHVAAAPTVVSPVQAATPQRTSGAMPAARYNAPQQPGPLPSNFPIARAPAPPAAAAAAAAPISPTPPAAHPPLPNPAALRPPAAPVTTAAPTPPAAAPTPPAAPPAPAASSAPGANVPRVPVPARKGNPRAVKQPESAPPVK
jgi:hypothetical protein